MLKLHKRTHVTTYDDETGKTKRIITQSNILRQRLTLNNDNYTSAADRTPEIQEKARHCQDNTPKLDFEDTEESISSSRHNTLRDQFRASLRNNYAILLGYHLGYTNQCQSFGCKLEGVWRYVSCSRGSLCAFRFHRLQAHPTIDANQVFCEQHLKTNHDSHGREIHIFLQRRSDTLAPSWTHQQLYDRYTARCSHSNCTVTSLGKPIRFVSQAGQQKLRLAHSHCLTVHQALLSIGFVASTSHKPELAFEMDLLTKMRELMLDANLNIHRFCEHLRLRSYTNTLAELDSNIYSSLRVFYPQFSAQMNAMETFSKDPHKLRRAHCVACRHNLNGVTSLTVDGNFSCKCKESQSQNPQLSFWDQGDCALLVRNHR